MNNIDTTSFLQPSLGGSNDWKMLEVNVIRLISHCGWKNIQYIGGSGDKGADILAVRRNPKSTEDQSFLFQVKSISRSRYVQRSAIDESVNAQAYYKARVVIVVTNGDFSNSAKSRRDALVNDGYDVRLWNGIFMQRLLDAHPIYSAQKKALREYQQEVYESATNAWHQNSRRCFFVLATGLGKTLIAAELADYLFRKGSVRMLVLCHSRDLIFQLQSAFWEQISKNIKTRVFTDGDIPLPIEGISFATYQSLFQNLGGVDSSSYDVVIVDEAHHALANAFALCISHLDVPFLIGMTATPWRGDGLTVDRLFGNPLAEVSLIDGMKMGYLSRVDYRLMCDNIKWGSLHTSSSASLSIRDLNKRLFVPQRDDAIIQKITQVVRDTHSPKIVIFSPSRRHAEEFARKLTSTGIVATNVSIKDKVLRRQRLLSFSVGRTTAITAVDVLNEGIDLPDANILVFLRATHSRRIFVQQLGRGLRLAPGKDKVVVLDFVTDIRRISAILQLEHEAKQTKKKGYTETVYLGDGIVSFDDNKAQKFINAWLEDVADIQDEDDASQLKFPNPEAWDD